jgi:hypothetical protein
MPEKLDSGASAAKGIATHRVDPVPSGNPDDISHKRSLILTRK